MFDTWIDFARFILYTSASVDVARPSIFEPRWQLSVLTVVRKANDLHSGTSVHSVEQKKTAVAVATFIGATDGKVPNENNDNNVCK